MVLKRFFTKKKMSIDFCQKNLDLYFDDKASEDFSNLLSRTKANVKEYECLSHCEKCAKAPYAMVNGKLITEENTSKLIRGIEKEIKT